MVGAAGENAVLTAKKDNKSGVRKKSMFLFFCKILESKSPLWIIEGYQTNGNMGPKKLHFCFFCFFVLQVEVPKLTTIELRVDGRVINIFH